MRRIALTGLLLLSGCTGFGHFIADTHSLKDQPNKPEGNSQNMQRAQGQPGVVTAMTPEKGQVWPTAIPTMPSLAQIQAQMNLNGNASPQLGPVPATPGNIPSLGTLPGMQGVQPAPQAPVPMPSPGVALPTSPGVVVPPSATLPQSTVTAHPSANAVTPPSLSMPKVGTTIQTPQGPATITGGSANYQTLAPIGGQSGAILIPNGNGTSTLVMPNGSISTVTTPK